MKVSEKILKAFRDADEGVWPGTEEEVLNCCALVGFNGFPEDNELRRNLEDLSDLQISKGLAYLFWISKLENYRYNPSMFIVTLSTDQLLMAKALKILGFKTQGWAHRDPRDNHATLASVWVLHRNETEQIKL